MTSSSVPAGVAGNGKVPGLYPSMTISQWNAAVDVLTAEELSATPNVEALAVARSLGEYLRRNGYRRHDVA